MANIDSLQIEINAQAVKANNAIDRLVGKLDRLTTSLSKINGTNLNGLANGVQRLGAAMQTMNTIKTADFTRLATNLTKLGSVNVSALNSAASSMSHLTRAFNSLGTVSANAQAAGDMAKNISKLGNKSVQTAIANIPQLAAALNNLMTTLSKSPRISQNVIQMTNALANLANQGSRVGSASSSMVRGLNNSSTAATRAKKSFGGLASAIGKFYATYFMVVRGLKGLWSSIESTADYIEAYNYFNVALGKIGSDWSFQWEKYGYDNAKIYAESFSTRLSESLGKLSGIKISVGADGQGLLTESGMKNLGLNIQEITQYASQLASVTNSVGQTGETSLAIASSFTKLAGDISSLFNVDYSSVAQNLQSGLIGQSRALYKYGIDITNATLQTKAYELGLSKAVSEMTQAEKMQLRTLAILEQSKVSWGDLANTINSPSNMIRQFTNNLKEAATVLGQLFIPVLQKVLPVVNGVVIAIKRLLVNIAGLLGIEIDLDAFGQGYTDLEDDLEDITDGYQNAATAAEEYKNQLLSFDEVNKLSEPTDTTATVGISADTIDLTDEILSATSEYEKVWNEAYEQMKNQAQKFADKIYSVFLNGLISPKTFHSVGETIANSLNTAIYTTLSFEKKIDFINLGDSIAEGINGFFENFDFPALGNTISTWLIGLKNTIVSFLDGVDWEEIPKKIVDFIKGVDWIGLFEGIGELIWSAIGASLELAYGTIDAAIGEKLSEVLGVEDFEELAKSFEKLVEKIEEKLSPALAFLTGTLLPDLKTGWDRILEILTPLGEFLEGAFTSIWQDMINPALTYIGETVLPKVTETFENLWNNVLVPLGTFLGDVFEPVIKIVSDVLTMLWENVVEPLADAVGSILSKAFESACDILNKTVIPIVNKVINVFQFLWNNVFNPIIGFLWDMFKPAFENVFGSIKDIIGGIKKTFCGIIDFVTGIFTGDWKRAWEGVKNIFSGIWDTLSSTIKIPLNAVIGVFEGLVNKIIDGWNSLVNSLNKFNISVPDWVPGIGGKKFGFNIKLANKISIPRLETGGLPEDGWFRASKGEYFGQFDDGTSYIANNNQITNGIAQAVYNAIMSANAGNSNHNQTPIIKVYVGERELTDIVIDGINDKIRSGGVVPLKI